jgi:NADPH:quinone reductase-like Zn-dependent oxidoreductase
MAQQLTSQGHLTFCRDGEGGQGRIRSLANRKGALPYKRALDQVAALVEAGTLRSTLTTTLPWSLEHLREGHQRIESRRTIGKIVLKLDAPPVPSPGR